MRCARNLVWGPVIEIDAPPVANAKGKGKAKGKTNAKAKGKAKGEAKVRPAGRLKPKRKANASVVIDTSPTTPPLPLKVCTRGARKPKDWEQELSLLEVSRRSLWHDM